MSKLYIILGIFCICCSLQGQSTSNFADSTTTSSSIYTRIYGELVYNQIIESDVNHNGILDARRIVLMMGYHFNDRVQFVTEVEFEHASEAFVEQAFIKYNLRNNLNIKGGLLLIPIGMINEDHEPTNFSLVNRPWLDKVIISSTWREMGIGISGLLSEFGVKYQANLTVGLLSYGNGTKLNGSGLRGGRQKGIKSTLSGLPSLSAKAEYYGIPNLKLGLSIYQGNTESMAYDGLNKNDQPGQERADSTVVDISMIGAHVNYDKNRWKIKGQLTYASLGNTDAYNVLGNTNIGKGMLGYYLNVGYKIINGVQPLYFFIDYSTVDTHFKVDESIERNPAYSRDIYSLGINWFLSRGAVFKMDYQFIGLDSGEDYNQFNTGIGVWF